MTGTLSFAERILVLNRALDDGGVRHGFGGAIALAYYVGDPRATRDIDLNVSTDPTRANVVLRAMPPGIEVPRGTAATIRRDGQVRLWWDGPDGVPVDLFFPQHPFHEEVARDTTEVPFLDTRIPIISATHLTVFKALFNRSRDWPDIEAMLQAGTVDVESALDWVRQLVGEDSDQYRRLVELAARTHPTTAAPSGAEMDAPRIDWRSL